MAITATLVRQGRNNLRYLINATAGGGESVAITAAGLATPDLVTDSLGGALKAIANTQAQGYGKIAPGGLSTQAISRALWLSDNAASVIGPKVATAIARVSPRGGTAGTNQWLVDALLVFNGGLGINVAQIEVAARAVGTCYLDIGVPGSLGL